MSVESWKKEFAPTPATEITEANGYTELDAARHSLQTWTGWLPENLEKHRLLRIRKFAADELDGDDDIEHSRFDCALCQFNDRGPKTQHCGNCILKRQGHCCLHDDSPYEQATAQVDAHPVPMITALEQAVKTLEAESPSDPRVDEIKERS